VHEGQRVAALTLATRHLAACWLGVRLGRSLRSSRTPASPSPADIRHDNQVVALGPMFSTLDRFRFRGQNSRTVAAEHDGELRTHWRRWFGWRMPPPEFSASVCSSGRREGSRQWRFFTHIEPRFPGLIFFWKNKRKFAFGIGIFPGGEFFFQTQKTFFTKSSSARGRIAQYRPRDG